MDSRLKDWGYSAAMLGLSALAAMPFWVLYRLSDCVFIAVYFLFRYRGKVVDDNLSSSFPNKTKKELKAIRRRFYRNFIDNIFETIKLLHVSDSAMRRRMVFENVELTDRYLAEGRHVVVYFSHCGNWEWASSFPMNSRLKDDKKVTFCQIYRPLRDQCMNEVMLLLRSRFGTISLSKRVAFLDLLRYKKKGLVTMTGFMSDQKPSHGDTIHVVDFLNRPTAAITGTETVARRLNAVVVYWDMTKVGRGHYRINQVLISDNPGSLPEHAITDKYLELLQQTIRRDPSIWLWTHKRWKNQVSYADNGKTYGV